MTENPKEAPHVIVASEELLSRVRKTMTKGSQIQPTPSFEVAPFVQQLDESMGIDSAASAFEPPLSPVRAPPQEGSSPREGSQFFLPGYQGQSSSQAQVMPLESDIPNFESDQRFQPIDVMQSGMDEDGEITRLTTRPQVGREVLFTPPDLYCKANKFPANVEPQEMPLEGGRDVASDGFAVTSDNLLMKKSNKRRVAHRLMWTNTGVQDFFGADGNLRNDAPNVIETLPMPDFKHVIKNGDVPIVNDVTEKDIIEFNPAAIWGVEDIDVSRDLRIEIHQVEFLVHPLSSIEDILCNRIRQLYDALSKDADAPLSKFYKDHIKAWRQELNMLEDTPEAPEKEKELLTHIVEAQEMKDMAEANIREQREALVANYNELREHRKATGVIVHPLEIKWKIHKFSEAEKEKQIDNFEIHLERRADEIVRLAELNGEEKDKKEVIEQLRKRHQDLGLHLPGDPLWKPILSEKLDITPLQNCPPEEVLRKRRIEAARVFIKIKIGDDINITSTMATVSQNFLSFPDLAVELKVTKIPEMVECEIWEAGYTKPRRIAVVNLVTTVGEPVDPEVYEFTAQPAGGKGRKTIGNICTKCFIVPNGDEKIIVKAQHEDDLLKKELQQDPSRFMSVPKLLEWAQTHDPNDPYLSSMLATVRTHRIENRVKGSFQLDPVADSTLFSSFSPASISDKIKEHIIRIQQEQMEEEMRKMKEEYAEEEEKKNVPNQITYDSVISANDVPTISSVFQWIGDLFRRRRPLQPVLETRAPAQVLDRYSQIVVRVSRVLNLPTRTQFSIGPEVNSFGVYSKPFGGKEAQLFMRICLEDDVRLTRIAYNDWNDLFRFDLCHEGEDMPTMAEIGAKTLRLDLFDKVEFGTDNEIIATEERFLGSLEIPISAVWATGEISGQFPLNTSPMLVGYETESPGPIGICASVSITPLIHYNSVPTVEALSERDSIKQRVAKMFKDLNKRKFKIPRRFNLLAQRTTGTTVLLSRLIHAVSIPEGVDTILKAIRFVSLIPYVPDSHAFTSSGDVWCTSQEFIDMRQGDEEEHAILLCNLLKALGKDAYVVLGTDLMTGSATYVAIIYTDHIVLIDPVRGNFYDSNLPSCTLTGVSVVFNNENIWCNIQNQISPLLISWDLHNKINWMPFFDNKEFPYIPISETDPDIVYEEADEEAAKELEGDVEDAIKQTIEEDRENLPTRWNEEASACVKEALEGIIQLMPENQVPDCSNILSYMEGKLSNYRVVGSPFALSFTSIERICDEIREQGTFLTDLENLQFGLAVSVVPSPHKMFYVWVFLVSIQEVPGGNMNHLEPGEERDLDYDDEEETIREENADDEYNDEEETAKEKGTVKSEEEEKSGDKSDEEKKENEAEEEKSEEEKEEEAEEEKNEGNKEEEENEDKDEPEEDKKEDKAEEE